MEEGIKFSALRVRDFRLFWLTQIVSLSGTWMQQVAIGWLVYSLTSSPFTLGLTMTIMSAPIMLFTLFGGITADRYPKKNIIVMTQILFIIPAFSLGVISGMDTVNMWHIYGLVFVIGVLNAFDTPARQSFIIELVGKGNLLNAIGLNAAAFHGARIIGPMLAGFLIARMGIRSCFFLNAMSYIPVIAVLMMVKERGADRIRGERSVVQDLADGLLYIRGEKRILPLFLVIAVISL
ncbi:MAG: MFS transporter, partial [Thermodesulfovibrionales bacterium]